MPDRVVGVRLEPGAPVVFCRTDGAGAADGAGGASLERGQRVTVAWDDGALEREGVVAIAPGHIDAAPAFEDAPRVVGVGPVGPVAGATGNDAGLVAAWPSPAIVFLTPEDADVGPAELRQALRLAALPLPEAPPARRQGVDGAR